MVERGSETRKALQQFIDTQRMFFVNQMVGALRENNHEDARKYAFFDQAYEEILVNMEDFITKAQQ